MPRWYYRGRNTTPINIPDKGSIVLRPRDRFEAPASAVARLVSAGLVTRLADRVEPKPEIATPPVKPASQSPTPVPVVQKAKEKMPAPEPASVAKEESKSESQEAPVSGENNTGGSSDVVNSSSEVVQEDTAEAADAVATDSRSESESEKQQTGKRRNRR